MEADARAVYATGTRDRWNTTGTRYRATTTNTKGYKTTIEVSNISITTLASYYAKLHNVSDVNSIGVLLRNTYQSQSQTRNDDGRGQGSRN